MSNALYDYARELFLTGRINWENDDFKVALYDTTNVAPNLATHKFVQTVEAALVGPRVTLTAKTTTGGAADAADATFQSVSGSTIQAILIYKDVGGDVSKSPLICYIDTATGLPITPNGGDIIVTWDNGNNKIFKL